VVEKCPLRPRRNQNTKEIKKPVNEIIPQIPIAMADVRRNSAPQ
jgi:hypothetical protein